MKNNFLTYLFFLLFVFPASIASAQTFKGMTFQANIKTPGGGVPPNALDQTVNLKILDSGNCILREENVLHVDVIDGYLSLIVGQGTRTGADPNKTFIQIMNNTGSITGLTCLDASGAVLTTNGTFSPTSADARKLRVSLILNGDPIVADFSIRSGAFAVNSESLNGKIETDFVQTSANITQASLETFMASLTGGTFNSPTATIATTATNVTGTVAIANGGTGATSQNAALNNLLPVQTGNAGKVLQTDGTSSSWVVPGSAPVTKVAGRTGDVVITTSDLADFATASDGRADARISTYMTANKGVANGLATLDAGGKIPSSQLSIAASDITVAGATLTSSRIWVGNGSNQAAEVSVSGDISLASNGATTLTKIRGKDIDTTLPTTTGQVLLWDQSTQKWNPNYVRMQDIRNAWGGTEMIPAASCAANESMTWSVITDRFTCQAIGSLGASAFAATVGVWDLSSGNVSRASGKVGIGTASPETRLDVAGAVRVADESTACSATIAGAIRFNSSISLFESCDGTRWGSFSGEAIPANSIVLMKACAAGWTDTGATGGGPGSASCGGTSCRRCQSPATATLIPASSTLLMESCPSGWTNLGEGAGPGSAGMGFPFVSCTSPAQSASLPSHARVMMEACPATWGEIGSAFGGPHSATCGASACRVCEPVPSGSLQRQIAGFVGSSTANGGTANVFGGRGGSTSGNGGAVTIGGGTAIDGAGGAVAIVGGTSASSTASSYNGGDVSITGGIGVTNGNGGNVVIAGGALAGAGVTGSILLNPTQNAKVGIRTATPAATLDVAGDIKFGNSSATCDGTVEGSQRYNSAEKVMEYCDGTNWTDFNPSGTMCGFAGNVTKTCRGLNPATSCPSGYTSTEVQDGTFATIGYTCIKN